MPHLMRVGVSAFLGLIPHVLATYPRIPLSFDQTTTLTTGEGGCINGVTQLNEMLAIAGLQVVRTWGNIGATLGQHWGNIGASSQSEANAQIGPKGGEKRRKKNEAREI
jgi:hypothetical protein